MAGEERVLVPDAGGYISPYPPSSTPGSTACAGSRPRSRRPTSTRTPCCSSYALKKVTTIVLDDSKADLGTETLRPFGRPQAVGGTLIYRLRRRSAAPAACAAAAALAWPIARAPRVSLAGKAGAYALGSEGLPRGHGGGPRRRQETGGRDLALTIGDTAPDFEAETSEGPIHFHEWIGDSWAVLFSHPKDFTPVCTTELGYMAKIKPEFDRRGVKIIGLSVDPASDHDRWADDIEETQGSRPNYPIIGDADFAVSKEYGMLGADVSGDPHDRTAAENQTVRNVFVIGPDKKMKLVLVYPMTTGRNFDEVLRVIDSLQLTAKHRVSTPVNWKQGEDVIIAGSVSNDEAKEIFGEWEEPKPYIRIVPQPN